MYEAFDEAKQIGVSTAGQSFFGNPANGSTTTFVPDAEVGDIDIIRANEKTAALIQRNSNIPRIISGQKNTAENKSTAFARTFPLSEEEGDITSDQLLKRVPGEPLVSSFTREQRARILATRHHLEHQRRNVRLFERLAWEVLLTGKQSSILATTNTDLIYDYRRNTSNTITVAVAWNAGANVVIMDNIDAGCDQMRKTARTTPDMMIVGNTAMSAMIKDPTFVSLANKLVFGLAEIGAQYPVPAKYQRYVDAGLEPRGFVSTPKGRKIWIFTYTDGYDTDAGVFTEYMDPKSALLISSNARFDRMFGPGETLPMDPARAQFFQYWFGFNPQAGAMPMNIKNPNGLIVPQMFMFDAYGSANAKTITIRTQTAPLFVTTQTDAVVKLAGLIP